MHKWWVLYYFSSIWYSFKDVMWKWMRCWKIDFRDKWICKWIQTLMANLSCYLTRQSLSCPMKVTNPMEGVGRRLLLFHLNIILFVFFFVPVWFDRKSCRPIFNSSFAWFVLASFWYRICSTPRIGKQKRGKNKSSRIAQNRKTIQSACFSLSFFFFYRET